MNPENRIENYHFELPGEQIAQVPADKRQDSRLLVLHGEEQTDSSIQSLSDHLRGDEILVVNDTRVVPARLFVYKETGGRVELLVLPRVPGDPPTTARAMSRSARPLTEGACLSFEPEGRRVLKVVEVLGGGRVRVDFEEAGGVQNALMSHGSIPLPPYIQRDPASGPSDLDKERYQTIFARNRGAVAAPTAGLHFTARLVKSLEDRGIPVVPVTLHVGPGTFLPVRTDNLEEHQVESEQVKMGYETARMLNKARAEGRRIIAVGTTVVRTLESFVEPDGSFKPGEKNTSLTIRPGHTFRAIDGLLTNFHLPSSSLLVLVATFAGRERILNAYRHAVESGYRFYSYGDAMLIV